MAAAPFTHVLPVGLERSRYVYLGQSLYGGALPLYCHDDVRSRSGIVIGAPGFGKTQLLLSTAMQDIARGIPTVFMDGKVDMETLNTLYFYTSRLNEMARAHGQKRKPVRFFVLSPAKELEGITHSWNPLHSRLLNVQTRIESFFNPYEMSFDDGGQHYREMQRNIFSTLCQCLDASGYAFNCQDLQLLLEFPELLDNLAVKLAAPARVHYSRLLAMRTEKGKEFIKSMEGFLNRLRSFTHWSLNSYHPTIRFDELLDQDEFTPVVYIGLPVNLELKTMKMVGNILISQLRAISSLRQVNPTKAKSQVTVIVDEAGHFLDESYPDWPAKARSSGFRLLISFHNLGDLEGRSPGYIDRVVATSPNVFVFNPSHTGTAKWFSELCGEGYRMGRTAGIDGDEETKRDQEKVVTIPKAHPDLVKNLRRGQCLYRPAEVIYSPFYLAACCLPPPPASDQRNQWRLQQYDDRLPIIRGLNVRLEMKMGAVRPTKK